MNPALISKPRFVFLRSVLALMIREMTTTYGRSPGGYLWAFAEPAGGVAMMTLVFSMIARNPPVGDNFPLYFASGLLPFMMYQSVVAKVGGAIRYSKPLLAYPSVTYLDAITSRLLLTVLTEIMVSLVVLVVIIQIYGLKLNIDYLACVEAVLLAVSLGLGIGLVNCYLISMVPIWQSVWSVLNRPLFLISGVFFLLDPLPEHVRDPLLWNPLAHPIMVLRRGLFDTYDAPYAAPSYVFVVSLCLGTIGMLLLHRYHRVILDEGM